MISCPNLTLIGAFWLLTQSVIRVCGDSFGSSRRAGRLPRAERRQARNSSAWFALAVPMTISLREMSM
ncbi:hypothetical protein D3C84_1185920 [compost metagenome]